MEDQREKKKLSSSSDKGSFLLKLLSQLAAMRGDDLKELPSRPVIKATSDTADELKEILRELKNVERQNFISHCLLTGLVVLTVTWELYELSLYKKFKEALSHPFRIFGSMFRNTRENGKTRTLKAPIASDKNGEDEESSTGGMLTRILKGYLGNDQSEGEKDSSTGSVFTRILKVSKGNDQNGDRETSTK